MILPFLVCRHGSPRLEWSYFFPLSMFSPGYGDHTWWLTQPFSRLCPLLNGTWKAETRTEEGAFGTFSSPPPLAG